MKIDFAPLEGVTDYVFRRLHHSHFGGVDRYYMPFLSPTQDHLLTPKELRELSPEHNSGLCVIPQLLTRSTEDFVWAAKALEQLGYREVNLNLGCPSGTVVAKRKGAGLLSDPELLKRFLDGIFSLSPIPISIKTRIGIRSADEFGDLLAIYRCYPVRELIVHPRTREELYRGSIHPEAYELARRVCPLPVTYNGDLRTADAVRRFAGRYPDAERVMIGRGLVSDPALACRIRDGVSPEPERLRSDLRDFCRELEESYCEVFGSPHSAMSRMKELWNFFLCLFDGGEKYKKYIGKARTLTQLREVTDSVFDSLALLPELPG